MTENREVIDNKYVIDRLIGVGGGAFVYKAWDTMLHKFVAVKKKKIHKEYAKDVKFREMFRNEAVNTAKLEHENIVRVVNFIEKDGDYYMIMDYVNGVDFEYLLTKCKKRNISVPSEIAVYIISEIAKALDYAHNLKDEATGEPLNIVHRDISPGNIMLYYNGRVKLTDFGIAQAGRGAPDDGKIQGKISYMSPEQAKCKKVDARSDLFSCGLVLYEALSGEKAYKGDTEIKRWKKAKDADVDFEVLRQKGVDEGLIYALKKVLRGNPSERRQSATEFFIDLKKYLSKCGSTEEIKRKYLHFLNCVLEEEIYAAEKEKQKDLSIKYKVDEESDEEEKAEEKNLKNKKGKIKKKKDNKKELKAKKKEHKKKKRREEKERRKKLKKYRKGGGAKKVVKTLMVLIIIGAAGYGYYYYTQDGDFRGIFEAGLIVDTNPTGAKIEIIDTLGRNIIADDRTPVDISEVEPGEYEVRTWTEDFSVVSRDMKVEPNEDSISVVIANSKEENGRFILPFELEIVVESRPSGAAIYINEERVGYTPHRQSLQVGEHNFRLERRGYETIGVESPERREISRLRAVCYIDMARPFEEQAGIDRRFWDASKTRTNEGKRVSLRGYMKSRD